MCNPPSVRFLKSNVKSLRRPLVIIDNLNGDEESGAHQSFTHYLKKELSAIDIIPPRELVDLEKNVNYLVLNQSKKVNGSSISLGDDTFLNSPWQALNEAKAGNKEKLDYYSRLKVDFILDFENNHQRVFQGCNIETIEQNKKYPGVQNVKKGINPISVAKLEMIRSELWLKEAVLARKNLQVLTLTTVNIFLSLFGARLLGTGKRMIFMVLLRPLSSVRVK